MLGSFPERVRLLSEETKCDRNLCAEPLEVNLPHRAAGAEDNGKEFRYFWGGRLLSEAEGFFCVFMGNPSSLSIVRAMTLCHRSATGSWQGGGLPGGAGKASCHGDGSHRSHHQFVLKTTLIRHPSQLNLHIYETFPSPSSGVKDLPFDGEQRSHGRGAGPLVPEFPE